MMNLATGEDDEEPTGGDIGEQVDSPVMPMPPPASQAPGAEMPGTSPLPAAPPIVPAMAPPSVLPAAMPTVKPYMPPELPPITPSRTVTPAEAGTLNAIEQNTTAQQRTAKDQGGVNTVGATARDQAAERDQWITDQTLAERKRIEAEATQRILDRQRQANDDYAAYKNFGIKDPEANDSFATRILKAIVVGMGQYASARGGGQNMALQIIQNAVNDNIAMQKAQQEKLFRVAEKSGKNVEEAQQQRDDAFRNLDLKRAALLGSSAALLRSELARLGIPQAQIDTNKEVQTLEAESLKGREKTLADIRDDETSLMKSDVAAAGRRIRGAAGGGGGGAKAEALKAFTAAANALQPGQQIPPDLIPLGVRAGFKPNQVATEVQRIRSAGTTSQGVDEKADRAAWTTYVGPHVRRSDELKRRIEALNSAEAGALNPKSSYGETISALEQGIAADAGAGVRGVSMGQLHSIIPNLVSAEGKISNLVSNNWDGTVGQEFRQATLRFIQRAKQVRSEEMRTSGADVERELAATPRGKADPDFAIRGRERLYPTAMAAPGGGAGSTAPARIQPTDPRVQLARQAVNDPNATPKEKAKALLILKAAGQ